MNEMKVVIAMTLKKYELMEEPTLKPKIIPRLVLRSLNGIHIRIKEVNRHWKAASPEKGLPIQFRCFSTVYSVFYLDIERLI